MGVKKFFPYAALLVIGVVWGTTIPLTKVAVSTGHHPFGLLTWQMGIMSVALGMIVLARRSTIVLDWVHLRYFFIIALIGTLIPNSISYWCASHLPAGVMSLVIAVVPVFSLLIAAAFGFEKAAPARIAGVILGGVAIGLIVFPDTSLPDPAKAIFVLVALVAPLFYGAEGNYVAQRQPADAGPFVTLFISSVMGFSIMAPISYSAGTAINPLEGLSKPEMAVIASSFLHIIAYSGYLWLTKSAGAVFAAQVSYIITPAGVLIAIVGLGEQPSIFVWLALIVLMVGIALVQPREISK